jgi:hypothetical protein
MRLCIGATQCSGAPLLGASDLSDPEVLVGLVNFVVVRVRTYTQH